MSKTENQTSYFIEIYYKNNQPGQSIKLQPLRIEGMKITEKV